jgi:CDP-diacylglycerol--glycerol-3-phosphate 3-phosphatidyltransferase
LNTAVETPSALWTSGVLHLPNILTLYRIFLSPVFIAFFVLSDSLWARAVCLALVISFLVTDYLDGYFARKGNLVSDSGKLLDPLADKICNFSVFLCFLIQGYAHIWMVAAIFYRDALVNLLRAFAAAKNIVIGARTTGKWKTGLQGGGMVIVLVLILGEKLIGGDLLKKEQVLLWSNWIMGVIAVVTCLSLIDYIKANWQIVRQM